MRMTISSFEKGSVVFRGRSILRNVYVACGVDVGTNFHWDIGEGSWGLMRNAKYEGFKPQSL